MIISHKYKFIFIAIPKTGTHAIRFAVRPHLHDKDVEQVNLFVQKKSPFEKLNGVSHGHITCREIKNAIGQDTWNSYFKFAIVRNPYDRFISYCSFMHRENKKFKTAPQPYLYNALLSQQNRNHILFKPQSHFLLDEHDSIMTDYTGTYEDLEASYRTICSYTGVPSGSLQKINASEHDHYVNYYNQEISGMVADFYKKDFQLFNYNF